MDEPNNRFHYTYSAPTEEERREIESIRREYQPREKKETDLERLRALDRKVKNLPMAVGLSLGVVGVLVFGLGMAMVLEWGIIAWGVAVGVVGAGIAAAAYPVYRCLLRKNRQTYGQEILSLSESLLNESDPAE